MAATDEHGPEAGGSPTPLLSMTATQEARLRDHLDAKLLALERDARKRRLGPLSALLQRLTPVLHLILQIPALEPWNSMRIAYLLRYTAAIMDYITSLPLIEIPLHPPAGVSPEEEMQREEDEAGETMRAMLDYLKEVERGWLAVLGGEGWIEPEDEDDEAPQPPVSVPVPGAGEVDQTSRVRLRSMVDAARDKLLAWARPYGDFGGEVLGPDGDDEDELVPVEDTVGWEAEVTGLWGGILIALDTAQQDDIVMEDEQEQEQKQEQDKQQDDTTG